MTKFELETLAKLALIYKDGIENDRINFEDNVKPEEKEAIIKALELIHKSIFIDIKKCLERG